MTRAIIYIPSGQCDTDAGRCLDHCDRYGYEFYGLEREWAEAFAMLADGTAHALVVPTAAHLDPKRRPRIEVVAEMPTEAGHHRTRIIRRGGAT